MKFKNEYLALGWLKDNPLKEVWVTEILSNGLEERFKVRFNKNTDGFERSYGKNNEKWDYMDMLNYHRLEWKNIYR